MNMFIRIHFDHNIILMMILYFTLKTFEKRKYALTGLPVDSGTNTRVS